MSGRDKHLTRWSQTSTQVILCASTRTSLIKSLLTVADRPPTFDVENVRLYWDEMNEKFEIFSAALRATVDFCRDPDVGIRAARFLSPTNTLLPLIYYLSRRPRCSVPDGQRQSLTALLYFLLFNRFVNSDARIRYLREVFQRHPGEPVPLDALLRVIETRQKYHAINTSAVMLNRTTRHCYTRIPEAPVRPAFQRTSLYQSYVD